MALRKPIQQYALDTQISTTAATGSGGTVVLRDYDYNSLVFKVLATAFSATATLDLWIQTSDDGGTTWYDMLRFPRVSASSANPYWASASLGSLSMIGTVGSTTLSSTAGGTGVPLLSNVLRTIWALGGTTPSASFSVVVEETGFDRGGQ